MLMRACLCYFAVGFLVLPLGCRTTSSGDSTLQDASRVRDAENLTPRESEDIDIYFHPFESTFGPVAELVRDPEFKRIDIAMYSMETNPERSEIIRAFQEQAERIESGDLKVRMLFQGYKDPCEKCPLFEQLGIDVRQVNSKDVHHKYGVFYGGDKTAVMTGSGNWSSSSNSNYDENMMLIRNHPGLAMRYVKEFQTLWAYYEPKRDLSPEEQALNEDDDPSNDIWDNWGIDRQIEDFEVPTDIELEPGIDVVFNSDNFNITQNSARSKRPPTFLMTNSLVQLIDSAEQTIHMATPRISLRPVYDALLRAAARGVKIYIMSTEAEYEYPRSRRYPELTGKLFGCDEERIEPDGVDNDELKKSYGRCCDEVGDNDVQFDPYEEKCSTSQNHVKLLDDGIHPGSADGSDEFPGHENMEIRLKLFTWYPRSQGIAKQMHAKFTIVDGTYFLAGSFNYSYNSEYKLFENAVFVDGRRYPNTVNTMLEKFTRIWDRGRDIYAEFQPAFEAAHESGEQIECPPIMFSLTYDEIEFFLATRTRHQEHRNLRAACR